jgi:nucleoside 2-deoxyribosyltransferase
MYKIYCAGSYSDKDVTQIFKNMRNGIEVSKNLLLKNYVPFCPWIDYHFFLALREDEDISLEQIQRYSMEWLGACDAVFVLPNSENSKGTQAEIKRAITLEIPVFTTFETMDKYFETAAKEDFYQR